MPLVPKAPSVQEIKDRAAQATAAVSSTASAVAGAAVAAVAEATAAVAEASAASTRALDVQPVWLVRRAAGVRVLRLRRAVLCHGRDQQLPLFGQSGGQGGCVFAHVQPGRLLAL